MDPKIVIIAIVAIVVIAAVAFLLARKRRTAALRERFGPEYERTVREHGTKAESMLTQRVKRVEKFRIRELAADERERFVSEWRSVQTRFVDDPNGAVSSADDLVSRLMAARGYPMSDFDQRAADISVDHPRVVDNYRAGHEIALRHRRGEATTEDLRNALIYYRSLFDELLQTKTTAERREVA
jgi:hypothetical protein